MKATLLFWTLLIFTVSACGLESDHSSEKPTQKSSETTVTENTTENSNETEKTTVPDKEPIPEYEGTYLLLDNNKLLKLDPVHVKINQFEILGSEMAQVYFDKNVIEVAPILHDEQIKGVYTFYKNREIDFIGAIKNITDLYGRKRGSVGIEVGDSVFSRNKLKVKPISDYITYIKNDKYFIYKQNYDDPRKKHALEGMGRYIKVGNDVFPMFIGQGVSHSIGMAVLAVDRYPQHGEYSNLLADKLLENAIGWGYLSISNVYSRLGKIDESLQVFDEHFAPFIKSGGSDNDDFLKNTRKNLASGNGS